MVYADVMIICDNILQKKTEHSNVSGSLDDPIFEYCQFEIPEVG